MGIPPLSPGSHTLRCLALEKTKERDVKDVEVKKAWSNLKPVKVLRPCLIGIISLPESKWTVL